MNITYLGELAKGQYFIRPSSKKRPRDGSLAKNNIEHLIKCSWNRWHVCTLCNGIMTFLKNMICSYLKGTANPEMILAKISSN